MIELLLDSHGTEAPWDGIAHNLYFMQKKSLGLQLSCGSLLALLTYPFQWKLQPVSNKMNHVF